MRCFFLWELIWGCDDAISVYRTDASIAFCRSSGVWFKWVNARHVYFSSVSSFESRLAYLCFLILLYVPPASFTCSARLYCPCYAVRFDSFRYLSVTSKPKVSTYPIPLLSSAKSLRSLSLALSIFLLYLISYPSISLFKKLFTASLWLDVSKSGLSCFLRMLIEQKSFVKSSAWHRIGLPD